MTPKFAFVCKILSVCLLTILIALPAMSQGGNQGSIEGTVLDQSGAVVSEATVTAVNTETGAKFTNTTTTDGFFRLPVLPVGTYDVTVERSGFARTTQKNVVLTVGGRLNLPITVKVASQSEAVEVTAEAPLVETTRSQVSTTVDSRSIQSLPVNGRNFIEFTLLTPGVNKDTRLGDISFGGLRGTFNSLVIDGTDNNNTFFGQASGRTGSGRAPYQFSQDAVQEFQVNTNGYAAELGRAGGAVVNAITKSGTNAFHGSAFWFYRDQSLNAGNPFNKINNVFATLPSQLRSENPPYHYNQFGGSFGGYFIKDKLFFFTNYDGQRNTQPNSVTFNPPPLSTTPAVAEFQTAAINYLGARSDSWVRTQNQDDYLGKLDWIVNSKNNASIRWNKQHFAGGNFENSGSTMSEEHTGGSNVRTTSVTASLNTNLTSTLVNVGRFSYVHDREPGGANSSLPELIVSDINSFTFTAGRNFFSPRETTVDRYQYGDNITWVKGRHTFKGGIDVIHDKIFNLFPGTSNGSYRLNLEQLGRSLCRSGLGTFTNPCGAAGGTFSQNFFGAGTSGPITQPNLLDVGVFVQDDWKVNQKLTLNLGIRYDLDTYAQPSFQNPVALAAGFDTSRINTDHNNIAPRFGFAWTPLSNRWVLRGGYGLFFSRTPAIALSTAFSNNGVAVQNRSIPLGPLFPNYPNSACGPVDAAGSSCPPPAGLPAAAAPTIIVAQSDYQQPYIQQWNLTTEYEVMKDLAVSIGYLGVKGTKLTRFRDVNLFDPVPRTFFLNGQPITVLRYPGATPTGAALRPNPAFARIEQIEAAGSSIYHAMAVQVTKRFSRNFQALASYTWSHGIDDNPDSTAVVPNGGDDVKLNYSPLLPGIDRASGESDIRNRFVLSGVWDLNYFNGMPKVAKAILEGWQVSGIFTAQGGQPYTAHISGTGNDINNDGNFSSERPPFISRNTFRLPGNYSLDPRITRKIRIREGMQFEMFAEAFNMFNRFNFYSANFNQFTISTSATTCGVTIPSGSGCLVSTANNATGFGMPREVIGAQPVQRVIQLGTKFTF